MNQRKGALESTILRFIGRSAEVLNVEAVGEQFRLEPIPIGRQLAT